jgi:3',5'-cyclic AMP phosphodiesterase CpdA
MARVILLSDLHLSPTHGFFWPNFCVARDLANAQQPELVIVAGDLCINGPDSDAELAFAAQALRGLRPRVVAIPGNHDVGDEPPGQDVRQLIDLPRLQRWQVALGADRFSVDLDDWRLIGLNAQLCGSGLDQEREQEDWLVEQLATAPGPIALLLHKPLFLGHAEEDGATPSCMTPEPRRRLLGLLRTAPVRLVISGHLHAWRDVTQDGMRFVWLPATSFVHGAGYNGATPMLGVVALDLSREEATVTLLRPPALQALDLDAIKQHGRWRFLRDMPPCPPDL